MNIGALDIAYPSLSAFLEECKAFNIDGQSLLDSGQYEYLPDGWTVSMNYFEPEAFERRGMDLRPSAFESRINTAKSISFESQYYGELGNYISGNMEGFANYRELDVNDLLGCYLMGEEL